MFATILPTAHSRTYCQRAKQTVFAWFLEIQMRFRTAAAIIALASLGCSGVEAASAAVPLGLWNRDDGRGGIRIAPCGAALCGDIVWLKDVNGPGHVGQRVLFNMRKTAQNTWGGTAVNPEDGQSYSGSMTLAGQRLSTQGCALGGMICKSVELSRPR